MQATLRSIWAKHTLHFVRNDNASKMNEATKYTIRALVCLMLCFGMAKAHAQECGCTDPRALNYNPSATVNDGSCVYEQTTVIPYFTTALSDTLNGTSGLVFFDEMLFTHNDHYDQSLFLIDTTDAHIIEQLQFSGILFQDVEDCDHDSLYVYLGDMGNNNSGNRTDLHFLRILKSSQHCDNPIIDTIWFSYADQTDFSPQQGNTTDFDCEAFVVVGDSIYLFTKQWTTQHTVLYAMPKTPGMHVAHRKSEYAVNGLVTSACYLLESQQIVLSGYSSLLQPFVVLLYDYSGNDFFSGNKRKISLDLPFHQVEAIAHRGAYHFFLTNEYISQNGVSITAKFHKLDLSNYLVPITPESLSEWQENQGFELFPNPTDDVLYIDGLPFDSGRYEIYNGMGQLVQKGQCGRGMNMIRLDSLTSGIYFIKVRAEGMNRVKSFVIK